MRLIAVPITIADANLLVQRWHRHHEPTGKHLWGVSCAVEGADEPCGGAIVALPNARMSNDGWTCEVVRVATDGTKNACSFLYGCAWRAARALGYKRCITYTLPSEGGASLRGAGFKLVGETDGGSWSRRARPRVDKHPTEPKLRWEQAA